MDLTSAITSVTATMELLQAAVSVGVNTAALTKINEAQHQVNSTLKDLIQAQQELFRQQKEIEHLHQQIKTHDDWEKLKAQYQLVNTVGGSTLYQSITDSPKHYACPACFSKKVIIPLQQKGHHFVECPSCSVDYKVQPTPPTRVVTQYNDL